MKPDKRKYIVEVAITCFAENYKQRKGGGKAAVRKFVENALSAWCPPGFGVESSRVRKVDLD